MNAVSGPSAGSPALRGIIPPMVTPLRDRDTLDETGLERLVEHILSGGVSGLFLLGTSGEAPSLSHRLRRELADRTCRQVAGRVPVLVGITDTSFVESLEMARHVAAVGADAVVLAPPYYFPAGQPELLEYLRHLASELPLPLMLYNMPTHTKLKFEPETVRAAADIPGVFGMKDSSADLAYFRRVRDALADRPDFALFIGPEELLAEAVRAGAHGGVCGGANLWPRLYVDLYRAAAAGDEETAARLQQDVRRVAEKIYGVGRYGSSLIKGLKCALSCMGICEDFLAEPFHRFRQPERAVIRENLKDLGLLA